MVLRTALSKQGEVTELPHKDQAGPAPRQKTRNLFSVELGDNRARPGNWEGELGTVAARAWGLKEGVCMA